VIKRGNIAQSFVLNKYDDDDVNVNVNLYSASSQKSASNALNDDATMMMMLRSNFILK